MTGRAHQSQCSSPPCSFPIPQRHPRCEGPSFYPPGWHHHGAAALFQTSARKNLKSATRAWTHQHGLQEGTGRTGSSSVAGRAVMGGVSCTSDTCSPAQLTHSFLLWALSKSQCNKEPLLLHHSYSSSFTASPWGHYQRHLISPSLPISLKDL